MESKPVQLQPGLYPYPGDPGYNQPGAPQQGYPGTAQQGYPGAPQQGYPGAPQQGYAGAPQQGYPGAAYTNAPATVVINQVQMEARPSMAGPTAFACVTIWLCGNWLFGLIGFILASRSTRRLNHCKHFTKYGRWEANKMNFKVERRRQIC